MKAMVIGAATALLAATGCQTTGQSAAAGAVIGAGAGALAGEAFAGRPGKGAAYGALIGAAVGAYEGCSRQGSCFGRARNEGRRHYDRRAGRYYYEDPYYGDTYWDDGRVRHYERRRDDYRY